MSTPDPDNLVTRLRARAAIRRTIPTRRSVREGQPDRLADLLEEAANAIVALENERDALQRAFALSKLFIN